MLKSMITVATATLIVLVSGSASAQELKPEISPPIAPIHGLIPELPAPAPITPIHGPIAVPGLLCPTCGRPVPKKRDIKSVRHPKMHKFKRKLRRTAILSRPWIDTAGSIGQVAFTVASFIYK